MNLYAKLMENRANYPFFLFPIVFCVPLLAKSERQMQVFNIVIQGVSVSAIFVELMKNIRKYCTLKGQVTDVDIESESVIFCTSLSIKLTLL